MWKDASEKSAFWTPCGDRSIVENVGRGSAMELGGWRREERRKRREGEEGLLVVESIMIG